jgi:heme/copper-type cytochrome/quinol oxidase subunit 1
MDFLRLAGMPRRVSDYFDRNAVASFGSALFLMPAFLFIFILLEMFHCNRLFGRP